MAKGRREIPPPPSCKTYGVPLYCASFVSIENNNDDDEDQQPNQEEDRLFVALGGGGGSGKSGVPNALILTSFDFASRSLSDPPVFRLEMDGELPYRMAMHPRGEGFLCSFPESCRWFEWVFSENKGLLAMKSSEKTLEELEDVGQQLALTFNPEGSMLATGGEDGHLRVFKWPDMDIILDQTDAHTSVKDLDFSSDAKYLVSLGDSGPCRVWDLTSSVVQTSLQREVGEMFGFCRFSRNSGENQMLYVTAMHGKYGKIISWNVNTWKRVRSENISRDSISAFSVSPDGKLLAIGTVEGNIVIVNSSRLQLLTTVKKAHLGIITAVVFSKDSRLSSPPSLVSRALVSTSFDSTVRVTLVESKKKNGLNTWLIILVLLLSFLVYYFMEFQRTP